MQPGDQVTKGQPLLFLSTDSSLLDGSSKNAAVLTKIQASIVELRLQQALLEERKNLDIASLKRQATTIEAEQRLLHAEIEEARLQVKRGAQKQAKLATLHSEGATSEWDVMRQEEDLGSLRQTLNRLRQKNTSLQREREQIVSRLTTLPVEVQARTSVLRSESLRLSQEVAEYESRRSTVVTSPIDGTVASVTAHAGNTSGPQQTLVTLLPRDWQLAAEFYVPSRAAGFLRRGQIVRLNYDAFPRQKFGTFAGKIDSVSDFVLLPAEVPQTFSLREATYRVQVEIGNTAIVTSAGSARLRPGMLLAAEIVLEKRNLIDWLLEPLRFTRGDTA
jgi:membrane fusion protein